MLQKLKRHLTRAKAKQQMASASMRHELTYLFLEVTRRCNLRCLYCGSGCSPEWRGEELPSAAWMAALEQIAKDFPSRKVMVAVTGGEPLLKDGVLELFEKLHALGFPYGMVTNATLITPQLADGLVAAGIGSISVSLDAPPAVNDHLRGKGVSAKIERGIRRLHQAGFAGKLEIISTITTPAVPHLDALRRYIATLKVPLWRLVPVMPIGRAAARADLVPGPDDIRTILDFVAGHRQDAYLPRPEFGEECYLGEDYEEIVRPYRFRCRAGISVAGILCDGSIGACPELPISFIQGHVSRERFKDVWEQRYQVFRDRSWTRRGICTGCDSFAVCNGGSLHLYRDTESDISRCFYDMLRGHA